MRGCHHSESLGSTTIAQIWIFRQTYHICKQTKRSRNALGQLAIESVSVVDIDAFAVPGV